MTGWTCRSCANEYHWRCEDEVNGIYCVCRHERKASNDQETTQVTNDDDNSSGCDCDNQGRL